MKRKVCEICRKRLKAGDYRAEDRDDGFCTECLNEMSVNELVEHLAVDLYDVLDAFELYPIRKERRC